jgi:hypothetical protein
MKHWRRHERNYSAKSAGLFESKLRPYAGLSHLLELHFGEGHLLIAAI